MCVGGIYPEIHCHRLREHWVLPCFIQVVQAQQHTPQVGLGLLLLGVACGGGGGSEDPPSSKLGAAVLTGHSAVWSLFRVSASLWDSSCP